jgi:transaldolase
VNRLEQLAALGQSIWLDFIRRDILENGELAALIAEGVRGMTSNPTIFEQAIDGSEAYDAQIRQLGPGADVHTLYDALTGEDIRRACDLFRPVYDRTGGDDGLVSVEVSPLLATDTDATVKEARRLWAAIDRPNVMIKVPATRAGLPAIRSLIAAGINVNVTLIFSQTRYEAVMDAYWDGIAERVAAGLSVRAVRSVASFFVSRVDTLVDRLLDEAAASNPGRASDLAALKGRAAVANAQLAYRRFQQRMASPAVAKLVAQGARPQRPLWASTSTKNPAYPDLLYVDTLVGPDTVNTVPPATLRAILDHALAERTVDRDFSGAEAVMAELRSAGIDMDAVTAQLEAEGVAAFEASFRKLLNGLAAKAERLRPAGVN